MKSDIEQLRSLGSNSTKYPDKYNPKVLESFDNRYPDDDYVVEIEAPEFTSLCPKTAQPDFASVTIRYVPATKLVESKSLKLYLFSFRSTGSFHEDCMNKIAADLFELLAPKGIDVSGDFYPCGGLSINPTIKKVGDGFTGKEGVS